MACPVPEISEAISPLASSSLEGISDPRPAAGLVSLELSLDQDNGDHL
jgi:hypothetical protein